MGLIADTITRAYRTSPKNLPPGASGTVATQERGRIGKPSAALYRNWAEHGEWINAACGFMVRQLVEADWDIVPYDTKGKDPDPGLQQYIHDMFDQPSLMRDSFGSFIRRVGWDLLTLDAGVIEKERTLGGKLIYIHDVDGALVKVNQFWDGSIPEEPRYWFEPTPLYGIPFRNENMVYMMCNERTYSPVGLSALEVLKYTIDSELSAASYNTRQVQNAAPDGIMNLGEGIKQESVDAFKSYWLAEVAGRGAMAFLGGVKNPSFIPFHASNRDMQFQEWQEYLVKKICAVMGLSPQDLGFTYNVNRSNGEVLQEKTESAGVRPFLGIVQRYLTREIVWDDSFGGRANNLQFAFTRLNIQESQDKASINKLAMAGVPWKTGNEARLDEGRPPFGDLNDENNPMNQILANTPMGVVRIDQKVLDAAEVNAPKPATPPADGKPKTPAADAGKE